MTFHQHVYYASTIHQSSCFHLFFIDNKIFDAFLEGETQKATACNLSLFGGNGGIALDERRHDAAGRFDAERQWRHVEEQQVLHGLGLVAVEDGRLDGGAVGHRLVRIDRLVQFFAVEEVLQQFLDLGDARRAADQDDLLDGALVHFGVAQRLLHRLQSTAEQVDAQLLEARPRHRRVKVNAWPPFRPQRKPKSELDSFPSILETYLAIPLDQRAVMCYKTAMDVFLVGT